MPDASGVSNVSQQTVREFLDEWDDIESEIGEVMAARCPIRRLNKVDLPTLALPTNNT